MISGLLLIGPVTITIQPEDTPPVLVGFTVSFLCQAQSIPAPVITWFRNGDEPVSSGDSSTIGNTTTSNLTISSITENDFATYTCTANNGGFFNDTSEIATLTRGGMYMWGTRETEMRLHCYVHCIHVHFSIYKVIL